MKFVKRRLTRDSKLYIGIGYYLRDDGHTNVKAHGTIEYMQGNWPLYSIITISTAFSHGITLNFEI